MGARGGWCVPLRLKQGEIVPVPLSVEKTKGYQGTQHFLANGLNFIFCFGKMAVSLLAKIRVKAPSLFYGEKRGRGVLVLWHCGKHYPLRAAALDARKNIFKCGPKNYIWWPHGILIYRCREKQ